MVTSDIYTTSLNSLPKAKLYNPELCGGLAIPEVFGPMAGRGMVPLTPKRWQYGVRHDPMGTKPRHCVETIAV